MANPKWLLTVFACLTLELVRGTLGFVSFEIVEYKTIGGAVPIATQNVVSVVHCASLCDSDSDCLSFTIDYDALAVTSEVTCNMLNANVTSVSQLTTSSLHYGQAKTPGTVLSGGGNGVSTTTAAAATTAATTTATAATTSATTTAATTTTSNTLPSGGTPVGTTSGTTPGATVASVRILDMVDGILNVCSGTSQRDFVAITLNGYYVYDDYVNVYNSDPCQGPAPLSNLFKDYSDLPNVADVTGVLFHQAEVELYTSTRVWRWQNQGDGTLYKIGSGSRTITEHLGSEAAAAFANRNGSMVWAAYRSYRSVERHFYFGNDQFVVVSDQFGVHEYGQSESVVDNNGFNMNPWGVLPLDVVAITGYTSQYNIYYAVMQGSGKMYSYMLDHSINNNDPHQILTFSGYESNLV